MEVISYKIAYWYGDRLNTAVVKPCCDENNVIDYAIYFENELLFNITKPTGSDKWVVSLKNADRNLAEEMVQSIGSEIDKHNSNSH